MSLFPSHPFTNLLPCDGIVHYHGRVAPEYYYGDLFNSIMWKHDEAILYGKRIVTQRKVAWYGDKPYAYTYSKTTKYALPWTESLMALKSIAEHHAGSGFNSCLLNLYHSGEEGMGWHSDDEKELVKDGTIASLSFGAERPFHFKHKVTGQLVTVMLENGSLLVMKGSTQSHWLHSLPKRTKIKSPRINLTFRTIQD